MAEEDLDQKLDILQRNWPRNYSAKRHFEPEMIAAVVIGVCALAVSIYETRIMRSQERAQVWPYLSYAFDNDDDEFLLFCSTAALG